MLRGHSRQTSTETTPESAERWEDRNRVQRGIAECVVS